MNDFSRDSRRGQSERSRLIDSSIYDRDREINSIRVQLRKVKNDVSLSLLTSWSFLSGLQCFSASFCTAAVNPLLSLPVPAGSLPLC